MTAWIHRHIFVFIYALLIAAALVALILLRHHDLNRICASQKQTVASVTNAFEEFRETVLLSYEQFPPDETRRARDAAFFNAVLKVLEPPDC